MAEAGAANLADLAGKLGMEQGQQAGVLYNLDSGEALLRNDGDDLVRARRGGKNYELYRDTNNPSTMYPVTGGGRGADDFYKMTPRAEHQINEQLNDVMRKYY